MAPFLSKVLEFECVVFFETAANSVVVVDFVQLWFNICVWEAHKTRDFFWWERLTNLCMNKQQQQLGLL